jgi:putative ABC transport system permease protein
MSLRRRFSKLGALFRRRKPVDDLEEEIRAHLEMEERENLESGMPPEEAHYAALRRFGNVTLVEERSREMWRWTSLETLWQDICYGLRQLRRSPGFTIVAVLTLAIGIGANTAIFSVVNASLFRALPFTDPDRIVWVGEKDHGSVAPANFFDWRRQNHVFSAVSAYFSWGANLVARGQPRRINRTTCSFDLLRLLGVRPALGRDFLPTDERAGHIPVAIISHTVWRDNFGGDPSAIGGSLAIDGRQFTIIGVMPAGFRYPGGTEVWVAPEREVPEVPIDIGDVTQNRGLHYLAVIGRLAPGVTLERARGEMDTIAARLATQYHEGAQEHGATVEPLKQIMVGDVRPLLLILLGAVGLVLLTACANVANLMLARARVRSMEMGVRSALGATRLRLVRQAFTESVLIALLGGTLGLLVSAAATRLLLRAGAEVIPQVGVVRLDGVVLGFTLAISMLTGILFGVAPVLQLRRVNVNDSLRHGARQVTGGRELLRSSLVVSEIALASVLSTGAGLLMRSFLGLSHQARLGFNPENVLTFSVAPTGERYRTASQQTLFYRQTLERLRALPGVLEAGVVNSLPPYSEAYGAISIAEHGSHVDEDLPHASFTVASPGYFQCLEIPLVRGRTFSARDSTEAPKVAVINQTFAHTIFAQQDPIGAHVKWFSIDDQAKPVWLEIVGVVGDVKNREPGADTMPQVYASYEQQTWGTDMSFVLRTASNPASVATEARSVIQSTSPDIPIFQVRLLSQALAQSISEPRFNLLLFAMFAILAVGLAAIGIYGVVSYLVTQRAHEIGIRMALGAGQSDVLGMVMGNGIKLSLVGVAIGLACNGVLTRLMARLLYGVRPSDPATFALVSIVLGAVALVASYIPARRATKVDPMVALRHE